MEDDFYEFRYFGGEYIEENIYIFEEELEASNKGGLYGNGYHIIEFFIMKQDLNGYRFCPVRTSSNKYSHIVTETSEELIKQFIELHKRIYEFPVFPICTKWMGENSYIIC